MTYAVQYKHHVLKGKENQFKEAWKNVATHFKQNGKALIFSLSKLEGSDNTFLSYSRWRTKEEAWAAWSRDEKTWQTIPEAVRNQRQVMRDAIDQTKKEPIVEMDVITLL